MKEIIEKYREFAHKVNPDIEVTEGGDWCCYSNTREIEIPQIMSSENVADFMLTVKKQLAKSGNEKLVDKYEDFIWCFLHEMGHLCKPKKYKDRLIRHTLDFISLAGFTKISKFFYYRLREEKTATKWACDYVIQNQNIVNQYNWEIVQKYIKFYQNLGITIDN